MKFSTFHLFHRFAGQTDSEVYDQQIELIDMIEESNFDGVWLSEHHFRNYGILPNIPVMLGYVAARTERLRLGSGVVVLPLHNPLQVAEEIAQLDVLSGGRIDFGIGRGYQSVEFGGYKIDLSEARERFVEALDVILGLWTNERFEFSGKFYEVGDVKLEPTPLQRPHPPLKIAAVSPETVTIFAKRGLPIIADPATPFNRIKLAADTWYETASNAGFSTDSAELVVSRLVHVAPTLEKAREDLLRHQALQDRETTFNKDSAPTDKKTGEIAKGFEAWQNYSKNKDVDPEFRWERQEVIGDPERVISQIRDLESFGYSHMMCDFGTTKNIPFDELKETIKLFSDEVIPEFQKAEKAVVA